MSLLDRYRDMPEDQRKRVTLIAGSIALLVGVVLVGMQLFKSDVPGGTQLPDPSTPPPEAPAEPAAKQPAVAPTFSPPIVR